MVTVKAGEQMRESLAQRLAELKSNPTLNEYHTRAKTHLPPLPCLVLLSAAGSFLWPRPTTPLATLPAVL